MQNVNKLIEAATKATNEEGVKVAWIKHGGFVGHITEKVDLFVPPAVLFEFKFHANLTSAWHKSLAQALIYVHRIHAGQSSLPMPSHVALVDNTAALLFPLEEQLLEIVSGDHSWDYAASIPDKKLLAAVKALGSVPRETYDATDPRQVTEFLSLLDTLPTSSRKKIVSAHNFDAVYSAWCRDIGSCIEVTDTDSLGPYFVADLREDAYFNAKRGMLAFTFNGSEHQVPARTYEAFWSLYGRPPATDVQSLIL